MLLVLHALRAAVLEEGQARHQDFSVMKAATADKASTEATQAHQDQQSSSSATTPPAIHTPRHQGQVTNRKMLCHLRVHFRGLSRIASEVASFTRRQQAPAVIARPRGLVTAITSTPR